MQSRQNYSSSDDEPNKTRGGALICLIWSVIWLGFYAHELAVINQDFQAPAGKNPTGFQNCYYSKISNQGGPLENIGSSVNVSAEFAFCVKLGLSCFCLKAFACLYQIWTPH